MSLEEVIRAAAQALRPGGSFVFSVEHMSSEAQQDFCLYPFGRYSHTKAYVETCLEHAGLKPLSVKKETLRQESGEPVEGLIVHACVLPE